MTTGLARGDIWAVVPLKETASAKQRLAGLLSPNLRKELTLAMFEDVLQALSAAHQLTGIIVVTVDAAATDIALRGGAQVWTEGARDKYEPADARYLSNHRGHLMFVRPEETHITGDVIRGMTLTGTRAELAERLKGMKALGYNQIQFHTVPGQESDMLERWAEVMAKV